MYVGANRGHQLSNNLKGYDRVFGFEPNPKAFVHLTNRVGNNDHVHLINAACGERTGKQTFYITPNEVSSSLGVVNQPKDHPQQPCDRIEVDVINLQEFLDEHNVNHIDYYISDAQGSDLTILTTIKRLIDNRKIRELMIETEADNVCCYKHADLAIGLNNQLAGFEALLSDNYSYTISNIERLYHQLRQ